MGSDRATPLIVEPPGWFGKLACVGDFASRRLDPTAREAWDTWISRCLLHSRAQLGARWQSRYLSAPVWFWLRSPEGADDAWHAGTHMPSVDNAGRYYPLVVTVPLGAPPLDTASWSMLEAMLRNVATACLATLTDGHAGLEPFDAQVRSAVASATNQSSPPAPSTVVVDWVLGEFARQLDGASLWWTGDGQRVRREARWPDAEAAVWLLADGG